MMDDDEDMLLSFAGDLLLDDDASGYLQPPPPPMDPQRKAVDTLRLRRDKLVVAVNDQLRQFQSVVGDDPKGNVLLQRIKSHLIFSIQRVAHHALTSDDTVSDDVPLDRQAKFFRCSMKILKSTLDDLKALCASSSSNPPVAPDLMTTP